VESPTIRAEGAAKRPVRLTRNDRRLRRLRRVPLVRLLARLGYEVDPDGEDIEQPFRCNLHGTGQDHKPSARTYPKSPRWHCFACSRSRDIVDTFRERTGATLEGALDRLEELAGLPPMSFEEPDEEAASPSWGEDDPAPTEDPITMLDRLARMMARARALPLSTLLHAWELIDHARQDPEFADKLRPRVDELREKFARSAQGG